MFKRRKKYFNYDTLKIKIVQNDSEKSMIHSFPKGEFSFMTLEFPPGKEVKEITMWTE